jgi:mannan endo-1,4-beta-mannosidase
VLRLLYRIGTVLVMVAAVATVVIVGIHDEKTAVTQEQPTALPAKPHSYLGVYVPGVPDSTTAFTTFSARTGTRPNLVVYYSGWYEPFRSSFAAAVAARGAVPLVQIDPASVNLALVAKGWYDKYLTAYAQAVREYGHPVIISIGHEMNGNWFPWGRGRTRPADFVQAWRHIVKVFRAWGRTT